MADIFGGINRRTYFFGLLVLYAITTYLSFLVMNHSRDTDDISVEFLSISLFLGLVGIVWDYKRIINISKNNLYLFLLLIPIISNFVSIFSSQNAPFVRSMLASSFLNDFNYMIFLFPLILIINFAYKIFLIFKKESVHSGIKPIA